jgi:predicted ArsR family transcriptional regulator
MCLPAPVDFWTQIDADVLRCLTERHGEMTPAEIGHVLGLSEQAVRSIVGMLAETGKVRITSVVIAEQGARVRQ